MPYGPSVPASPSTPGRSGTPRRHDWTRSASSQVRVPGSRVWERAITKNGYTRSVWSQKRVQPGVKSKIHSTSHAIGQKQIVPVFQRLWPGYTCKWLLCSGFQPFLIICYSEYLFCTAVPGSLRLRSLFSFGFWFIFALQFFHYDFHFTLFNHYAHLPT